MEKLSWKAPTLEDLDKIRLAAEINNQIGNEMSAVNLFLYQIKYETKIAFFDDMLFRQYKINNQKYFGFPLVLDSDICKSQKAKEAKILQGIDILRAENQETGKSLSFFYVYYPYTFYNFSAIRNFALLERGFCSISLSVGTITLLFTKRNGDFTFP